MKIIVKISLFIALILFADIAYSQPNFVLKLESGKIVSFPVRNINGIYFLPLRDAAKAFKNASYDNKNNEILSESFYLRCSNGSFFVACFFKDDFLSNEGFRSAQMTIPALEIGSVLYVPARSFFYSLINLGIISAELTDPTLNSSLSGSSDSNKGDSSSPPENTNYNNNLLIKISPLTNVDYIKYLEAKRTIETEKAEGRFGKIIIPPQPPNKYTLPENLFIDEKQN